ncbi:hypothetical protein [Actinosynnema mirum]|uniref:Uncharacterized protein n=1 Tax=Actinosynnema mirum (strain ATCC 29888 / DSM 43827 / JCM 3225 / NBRC 14064 / NCIMB 13271 / NRRL B-12336 / IMRU 3971 / 101) TaxID=446462 RepID=C6WMJ1_ACTMD|nr:hypothetical protein [Actinosynnema mirum]ACU36520.1 hypothetical protein Amir_2583 [Actinosynnema mirum DSM 43827]
MAKRQKLNPLQQKEILDEVTGMVLDALPQDWDYLELQHHQVGNHMSLAVGLRVAGGCGRRWDTANEVWYRFQDLRSGMYCEGQGTWFSLLYRLERPGRYSVSYEWEQEPAFSAVPPPGEIALELRRFPRDPEYVPDWFRVRSRA